MVNAVTKESRRTYLAREGLSWTGSRPEVKPVEVPFRALPLKRRDMASVGGCGIPPLKG